MAIVDLRTQIVYSTGTWRDSVKLAEETPFTFTLADTCSAGRLMLRWEGDAVALAGPLRLQLTFQAETVTYGLGAWSSLGTSIAADGSETALSPFVGAGASMVGAGTLQTGTVYEYKIDVPAGQVWAYAFADPADATRVPAGYDRVVIEVAGLDLATEPIAASCDLPCDFAVADIPDTSSFFPAACEPCDANAMMRMPQLAPALSVPSADGGCVRARFFNGMFITKEDLETEQRYFRIKNRLRNRAAGQGVVWGLNVGKQGDSVIVLPGYGVDCCGNDLTVTSLYKVDIAALLRDPAAAAACAAAAATPQRMALLLEYVECPSEPRPVHGDPCGPTQTACEPSRIRETVRLRLVPPRDPATKGPMADFLATAKTLHDKYGAKLPTVADIPGMADVRLTITGAGIDVSVGTTSTNVFSGASVEVTIGAEVADVPFGTFTGGTLVITDNAGAVVAETELSPLSIPGASGVTVTLDPADAPYTATMTSWRAETPLAPVPRWADTGSASFDLRSLTGTWEVTGRVVAAPVRGTPSRTRACEPCPPPPPRTSLAGAPLAPATDSGIRWPFLHSDPLAPEYAGDPKALVLGVLGAWLQSSSASAAEAGVTAPSSFQEVASDTLYRGAWLLFYGVEASEERCEVGDAMLKLLRGWCAAMMYPGPVCEAEPHGVVIGCTTIEAGTLGTIDPFGGRRYVVQYPLLSHWGAQIGIAPLDLSVTRLFSVLCCAAALPCPPEGPPPSAIMELGEDEDELNASYLAFGTEAAIAAAYTDETGLPFTVAATHRLSLAMFVGYVVSALQGSPPPTELVLEDPAAPDPNATDVVERFTLGTLVEPGVVSLLVSRRVVTARVVAAGARRRARRTRPPA